MLSYEILKYSRVSCDIARGKALDLFFDGICIFLEQYLNKLYKTVPDVLHVNMYISSEWRF